MKLFVPGRICLFGEHTDWAGGYRRINAKLEKGHTLITGASQGLYAEVRPHSSKLILRSTLETGETGGTLELPMSRDALLQEAEQGGFFSYAAGVAYQILTHYRVRGLEIDNYKTDLPMKKGLSSSAAICVLVARAFNRIYDLKMTVRGEMEYAYLGEITTPSRCGRMDQGCAYGNRPIVMSFDGDRIDVRELNIQQDLHFIIVDLHAEKNTKEILARLNQCYPFAENEQQLAVQEYLGPISARLTREAEEAIVNGDAERLGALMTEAQREFDARLGPVCPSQLTAPVLHKVLAWDSLQPYVLGGKGVGSQGDGSAQFVVRDRESQDKAIEIIEGELGMSCLRTTLQSSRRVRKAVIPAAGVGARLFPATKGIRKELFPIVDSDGRAKPVILVIIEEALSAGIEEIGIVVQEEDRQLFEEYFGGPPPIEHFHKLSRENQQYCQHLQDLGSRITWIPQTDQEGLGHAVFCAREWVGDEPFLLLLGDHLYRSDTDASCARQLLDAYDRVQHSVVSLTVTPERELHRFGCVGGVWRKAGELLEITEFYEKPSLEYARERLHVDGMPGGQHLTFFGQYVLTPRIFGLLSDGIRGNARERGEFQLTSRLDQLRQEDGFSGFIPRGRRFDIGTPSAYLETLAAFRESTDPTG